MRGFQSIPPYKRQVVIALFGLTVKIGSSVPGLEQRPPLRAPSVELVPTTGGLCGLGVTSQGTMLAPMWWIRAGRTWAWPSPAHSFYRKVNQEDGELIKGPGSVSKSQPSEGWNERFSLAPRLYLESRAGGCQRGTERPAVTYLPGEGRATRCPHLSGSGPFCREASPWVAGPPPSSVGDPRTALGPARETTDMPRNIPFRRLEGGRCPEPSLTAGGDSAICSICPEMAQGEAAGLV